MKKTYKWGIVGPGGIAHKFADALNNIEHAELQAVASNNPDRAKDFALKYSVPNHYSSYHELFADDSVDMVYVATTHNFHYQNTIDALNAGKGVLVEKSMAVNASQVEQMIDCARKNDKFLMEAMWTRFLPMMVQVRDIIAKGIIGKPNFLQTDFGVNFEYDPQSRIFNPDLAGGALLDIGIYCLSLASMIFGKPRQIASTITMSETGVDQRSAISFKYDNAETATIFQALDLDTPRQALIVGTEGSLTLHPLWMAGNEFTLKLNNGNEKDYTAKTHENGFIYQIMAVQQALDTGKKECDTMSLAETLAITETMDALRNQWNFKYPFE